MAFTNAGGKFYICATPQAADLDAAGFAGLTWVQVGKVGSMPEMGVEENIVSYDTLDQTVTDKDKGIANAGDRTIEVAYVATDTGQIAMRTAALTGYKYAFKRELTDAPDTDTTNTIMYSRGLLAGPLRSGGRNEDFVVDTYQIGFVQKPVTVGPTAIP